MSTILIQQASGAHEALLRLAEPLHAAYCAARGIDYVVKYGMGCNRQPWWTKFEILIAKMLEGNDDAVFVVLDADTLIVGKEHLGEALPEWAEFGAVRNRNRHFNCGALWFRNNGRVRRFLADCYIAGDLSIGEAFRDQGRVNAELTGACLRVAELDCRWNRYDGNQAFFPRFPVQVQAWHSMTTSIGSRLAAMKAVIDAAA